MINLIAHRGELAYGVKTFVITEANDVETLPLNCAAGSTAFLLVDNKSNQKSYCFNGIKWVETDFPMYTFNVFATIGESEILNV